MRSAKAGAQRLSHGIPYTVLRLPTHAAVGTNWGWRFKQSHKIDYCLVVSQCIGYAAILFRLVCNDDYIAERHNTVEIWMHQFGNVGYFALDIFFVRAKDARQLHVTIVDSQAQAFAQQSLNYCDDWTLTQVIRALLETEP